MPRPTYSRPIRDRILHRAAEEARPLTSDEKQDISRERSKLAKSGYRLLDILDEDERASQNLTLLLDLEDEMRLEAANQKAAKQEEIEEELNAEERAKSKSAARRRRDAIEEAEMKELRQKRRELREELLRSGALIAFLLAP